MNGFDKGFWILIALICLTHGLFLVPTFDCGNYYYQIYNTIGLKNPFYNDFYGQYFHFMKPSIILNAYLFPIDGLPNFRIMALFQGLELIFICIVMYLCLRKYVDVHTSKAGTLLFLYVLFAQYFLTPTRPETIVVLCILSVFWLCECFSVSHKTKYLVIASAITFLFAIPMHTNGIIPLIYLILYLLIEKNKISWSLFFKFTLFSFIFAFAGFIILAYPNIQSFAESIAMFSYDGDRFSLLRGEYFRIIGFINDRYFFPLALFMTVGFFVFMGKMFFFNRNLKVEKLGRFRNIVLLLISVLICLGVLPAALWQVYMVYYCIPVIMLFSVVLCHYNKYEINNLVHRSIFLFTGVLTFLFGYYGKATELYLILYAGPFLLAGLLFKRFTLLHIMYVIITSMLFFKSVEMITSKIIYERAVTKIQDSPNLVIATPLFNFAGKNVFPVSGWEEYHPIKISVRNGNNFIELNTLSNTKKEQIMAHPLVKLFTPLKERGREKSVLQEPLGDKFCVIGNQILLDYLEGHLKPSGYSALKEICLSDSLIDKYANFELRGLQYLEYSNSEY